VSLKAIGAKIFAKIAVHQINQWASNPLETQERVFKKLIATAKNTAFGKDHGFAGIASYQDFFAKVPVRDYEALRNYVDRVVAGEKDILWP
jgi:hypothetical protein